MDLETLFKAIWMANLPPDIIKLSTSQLSSQLIIEIAPLIGPDGQYINSYGKRELCLDLSRDGTYIQTFWIANVSMPILRANFFVLTTISQLT